MTVVLLTGNRKHRITVQRYGSTQKLPVAVVTCSHYDALALSISSLQIFQALYLYLLVNIILIQQREAHNLNDHAAEAMQTVCSDFRSSCFVNPQAFADIGLCHLHTPARYNRHCYAAQEFCHQLAQQHGGDAHKFTKKLDYIIT